MLSTEQFMKTFNKIYEAKVFKNIKEIIENSAKLYPDNKAFIIKEKKGKDISYKNITGHFGEKRLLYIESDFLGGNDFEQYKI